MTSAARNNSPSCKTSAEVGDIKKKWRQIGENPEEINKND